MRTPTPWTSVRHLLQPLLAELHAASASMPHTDASAAWLDRIPFQGLRQANDICLSLSLGNGWSQAVPLSFLVVDTQTHAGTATESRLAPQMGLRLRFALDACQRVSLRRQIPWTGDRQTDSYNLLVPLWFVHGYWWTSHHAAS